MLGWLAAGGGSASAHQLEPIATRLAAIRPGRAAAGQSGPSVDIASLSATPIFPMTTGPGAQPQPSIRLDGLVRARSRVAALLSINDRPAEWLTVGDSRDGVTLQQVAGSKVVVDTVFGPQEVALGERTGAAATVGSDPAVEQTVIDTPPPGVRSPPPPASAPRAP